MAYASFPTSMHSYMAKIDLANAGVNAELAYDLADPSSGLFNVKRVEKFVEDDSGAGEDGEIAHYFVAINGTAKNRFFLPTAYSDGSILGIGGTTYGKQCVGGSQCIDQPKASFFPFRYQSPLGIHRTGIDFPSDGGNDAREYIQLQIDSSLFTVGYRSTILDTIVPNGTLIPDFPEYVADPYDHDDPDLDDKTALGVSTDGSNLYLAAVDATVSLPDLAAQLMYWGAAPSNPAGQWMVNAVYQLCTRWY